MELDDLNKANQVVEHIDRDTVRVYHIVAIHLGTDDDPLTTIEVSGYEDIPK